MYLNGGTYALRKGSCFIVHPGDEPRAEQHPNDRLTVIFVHFSIEPAGDGTDPVRIPLPRFTQLGDTYWLEALLHRIVELSSGNELWPDAEFDSLLKQIAVHLLRRHAESPRSTTSLAENQARLIRQLMAYMRMEPHKRLELSELAARAQLSPQYLSRLFKQHTGTSLKQFKTQVRLERAMHLLTESTMNISQIADTLGYSDLFSFSKLFKRYYGHSPSHYRSHTETGVPHPSAGSSEDDGPA